MRQLLSEPGVTTFASTLLSLLSLILFGELKSGKNSASEHGFTVFVADYFCALTAAL